MIIFNILILLIIIGSFSLVLYLTFKKRIKNKYIKISFLLIIFIYFSFVLRNISIYTSVMRYRPYAQTVFSFYYIENGSIPQNINDIRKNKSFISSKGKFRGYEPDLAYKINLKDSTYYFYTLGFDFDDDNADIVFEPSFWNCFYVFQNGDILILKNNFPKTKKQLIK